MSEPITLAVLHDAVDFGGHERAFLMWLPALLRSPLIASVVIWTPRTATRFRDELAALAQTKLKIVVHAFQKRRAEPFLAPMRFSYGMAARRFIADAAPDVVLLLQGRIESLSTPLLWLPRRTKLVSYVPMAHLGPEMGRSRWASTLTDRLKRSYYARPQSWITVSNAVAGQLRRAGARGPIWIVENVPSSSRPREALPPSPHPKVEVTLYSLGRPALRTALFMGRFDAGQKGLDRLVAILRRDAATLRGWQFLFVGQGPAEPLLRELVSSGAVQGEVREWTDDPATVLDGCDVLLMPSRFEGVPLILLEAMQAEKPVLASPIDVFQEYLPLCCIYDFTGAHPLEAAMERLLSADGQGAYRAQAREAMGRMAPEASGEAFLGAVLEAAHRTGGPRQ